MHEETMAAFAEDLSDEEIERVRSERRLSGPLCEKCDSVMGYKLVEDSGDGFHNVAEMKGGVIVNAEAWCPDCAPRGPMVCFDFQRDTLTRDSKSVDAWKPHL